MPSYGERLRTRLESLVARTDQLLDVSRIDHDPRKVERMSAQLGMAILTLVPDSTWAPLDEVGRRLQREILQLWKSWREEVELLFSEDSTERQEELAEATGAVNEWLQRSGHDFSVPPTIPLAKERFRKHVDPLFELLEPFTGPGDLVVVPDTNVLLRNQDLPSWSTAVGATGYTVLLVPGVLTELDEHKVSHRVPAVQEKARRFSDRLKGWRNQGSLSEGVRVQGGVFVRVVGREPNFRRTLSWLDPDIADDRILASVLELQRAGPRSDVRLLTGDSIMLAKADEASITTGDVPEREST
jgi:hypothetical protein